MPREDAFLRNNRGELDEQHLTNGVVVKDAVLKQTETITKRFQDARYRVVNASKQGASHLDVKEQRDHLISTVRECFEGIDGINSAMVDVQAREMESLSKSKRNLDQQLQKERNTREEGSLRIEQLRREVEKLQKEQRTTKYDTDRVEQKHGRDIAALRDQKERAEGALRNERKRAKDHSLRVEELQRELEKLQKQDRAKKRDADRVEQEHDRDIAALRDQKERVERELRNERKTVENSSLRLEEVQREMKSLEDRHAQAMSKLDRRDEKMKTLRADNKVTLDDLDRLKTAAEKRRHDVRNVRQNLGDQVASLKHDVESANFRLATAESDRDKQIERNAALLVDILTLVQDIQDVVQHSDRRIQKIINDSSDEVHSLLLELEQSRNRAHSMEVQRDHAQMIAMQRGSILQATHHQHHLTRKELEASRTTTQDLKNDFHQLTSENSDLTESRRRLSRSLADADDAKEAVDREFLLLQGQHGLLQEQHGLLQGQHKANIVDLSTKKRKINELQDQVYQAAACSNAANSQASGYRNALSIKDGQIWRLQHQHETTVSLKDATINRLQQSYSDSTDDAGRKKRKIDELQHQHETTLSLKDAEITRLQQSYRESTDDVAHKKRKIDELETQVSDVNARLNAAENQATGYRTAISVKDGQISHLKHHHTSIVALKDTQISTLQTQAETAKKDHNAQIEDYEDRFQAMHSQVGGYRRTMTVANSRISLLQHDQQTSTERHNAVVDRLSEEKRGLEHAKAAAEVEFQDELQAVKAQASGYRTTLQIKDGHISLLQHDRRSSKERHNAVVDRLRGENRDQGQDLENQLRHMSTTADDYQAELKQVRRMLRSETSKKDQLSGEMVRLENRLEKRASLNGSTARERKAEIGRLEGALAGERAEKDTLSGQVDRLKNQLTNKTRQIDESGRAHSGEVRRLKDTIARERSKNDALNSELTASEQKVSQLEAKVAALEEEVNKGKADLASMKDKLQVAADKASDADESLKSLKWRYSIHERYFNAKEKELKKVKTKLARKTAVWRPTMIGEGGF